MYPHSKRILATLVIIGLAAVPAMSGETKPLGVVLQAQRAQIGVGEAQDGATLFAGDVLQTGEKGKARVRFGSAQVYMADNSAASFGTTASGVNATMTRGSVGFAATATDSIGIEYAGITVRAKSGQEAHALVTVAGPNELIVNSYKGTVEVSAGEDVQVIPAGTSYRAMLAPEPQQPSGAGRRGGGRRILLLLLIGAAAGVGIWLALRSGAESPFND